MVGGAEGRRLFEECDYFKYFRPREAINRWKAIIRGNTVYFHVQFDIYLGMASGEQVHFLF